MSWSQVGKAGDKGQSCCWESQQQQRQGGREGFAAFYSYTGFQNQASIEMEA